MQPTELKSKMIKLWKATFHDSDEYTTLVFDNYFDPELVAYHEEKGHIVSALLGVPYIFGSGNASIRGLYLCGLATEEEYRHRGIMNSLIESINEKAASKGFAFTFLIPASDPLINYYSARGYVKAIHRVEERYTEVHDFRNDYISSLASEDERVRGLKEKRYSQLEAATFDPSDTKMRKDIIDYISAIEHSSAGYTTLLHSDKDLEAVVRENAISGGKIVTLHNASGEIAGVAFVCPDEKKRVVIPKAYHNDEGALFKMLEYINSIYPDSPLTLFRYPEETDRRVLWMKSYGAASPDGLPGGAYGMAERVYNVSDHAKPYGMIRVTDIREILEFLARDRKDVKFSILVKESPEADGYMSCVVDGGKVRFSEVSATEKPAGASAIYLRDLLELLFRKKDSSPLVMEAFGIPRLAINMALLLD